MRQDDPDLTSTHSLPSTASFFAQEKTRATQVDSDFPLSNKGKAKAVKIKRSLSSTSKSTSTEDTPSTTASTSSITFTLEDQARGHVGQLKYFGNNLSLVDKRFDEVERILNLSHKLKCEKIKLLLEGQRSAQQASHAYKLSASDKATLKAFGMTIVEGDIAMTTHEQQAMKTVIEAIAQDALRNLGLQKKTQALWCDQIVSVLQEASFDVILTVMSEPHPGCFALRAKLAKAMRKWLKAKFVGRLSTTEKSLSEMKLRLMMNAWIQKERAALQTTFETIHQQRFSIVTPMIRTSTIESL